MKYYKLIKETDSNIIGNVGGIQSYFSPNFVEEKEKLMNKDLYSKIDLKKIKSIELDEKAKLTDVVSHGTLTLEGLIVSSRFKQIVEKYKLLDINFVDISFNTQEEIKGYYFMFFNSNLTHDIDYDKTKFGIEKVSLFSDNSSITPVDSEENNIEGLTKLTKEYAGSARYKVVSIDKYVFKEPIVSDVFRIGHFDKSFYFSENVYNELFDSRLTGFYFKESNFF